MWELRCENVDVLQLFDLYILASFETKLLVEPIIAVHSDLVPKQASKIEDGREQGCI